MNRIQRLRDKIKARTKELGIEPDHDDTGHWYKFNGVRYPSVTGKLAIIKDEGLMNWKMNRALEYVLKNYQDLRPETIEKHIQDAKLAPVQEFTEAGDIGTAVHAWREGWFNTWIDRELTDDMEFEHSPEDIRPEVISACAAIVKCIKTLRAQPLACELYLADEKLGIGGTMDDLWAVPVNKTVIYPPATDENDRKGIYGNPNTLRGGWETWLIDLKTSNIGTKNSYYMQTALYWHLFKKLYKIKVDKVFILHVSKKIHGEYKLIEVKHPKRYLAMAKNVIKLHDDLEEIKELKKPEITKI